MKDSLVNIGRHCREMDQQNKLKYAMKIALLLYQFEQIKTDGENKPISAPRGKSNVNALSAALKAVAADMSF